MQTITENTLLVPTPAPAPRAPARNIAVDAYRGFVMLLMMAEVLRLSQVANAFPGSWLWRFLAFNQSHVEWAGCSLHDTIQPSFSFLGGRGTAVLDRQPPGEGFFFRRDVPAHDVALTAARCARHLPALPARPDHELYVRRHADADRAGLYLSVPARLRSGTRGSGPRSRWSWRDIGSPGPPTRSRGPASTTRPRGCPRIGRTTPPGSPHTGTRTRTWESRLISGSSISFPGPGHSFLTAEAT